MTRRVCITGGPRTGKTTLAGETSRHTDDLISSHDWSAASAEAAQWLNEPGDLTVEGVAVPRALRKWLDANPTGKPCDEVIVLQGPHVALTPGQRTMAKGVETVMNEIAPELEARGVVITRVPR